MTIWKFDIYPGITRIAIPSGANLLSVQMQQGVPRVWALVDPDATHSTREIETYPTGHVDDVRGDYIGTFQVDGLVFHAFDHGEV